MEANVGGGPWNACCCSWCWLAATAAAVVSTRLGVGVGGVGLSDCVSMLTVDAIDGLRLTFCWFCMRDVVLKLVSSDALLPTFTIVLRFDATELYEPLDYNLNYCRLQIMTNNRIDYLFGVAVADGFSLLSSGPFFIGIRCK